ncbi:DMT family transporter [Levilinea saccharolytica]|nr:DMT family transporter [Levilinea saccharolytica]GAP16461.1 predicted membrane protein [Levilinea saccharolytica]
MSLLITRYMGELAALAAAMIWSVSSMIWAQLSRKLTALELNLLKGVLAGIMFLGAMAVLGEFVNQVAPLAFILLCISGFIGIGLGDTAYMKALQAIGARRTLLMGTLSPPMTGIIAWIFLGETLPLRAWVGILITILGVAWVITDRTPQPENAPNNLRAGIIFGLISGLTQAVGSVLSRFAFMYTDISPLTSALIRMSAGSLLLIVWLITLRQPVLQWVRQPGAAKLWGLILIATFSGAFIGMWLQQVSLDRALAGVSQTLISTSPLFVLPVAALMGEKVSARAVVGVLIALVGVGLLFGAG